MKLIGKHSFVALVLMLTPCVSGWSPPNNPTKFDEFGDINCEDEWARLDNFAVQLQQTSGAQGFIIFHGGRLFRGRLPKRGEAAARAARMKPYLVNVRGIPSKQITVIDGGFSESWTAELWIAPSGVSAPLPLSTIPKGEIKFRRGRVTTRQFSCHPPG